jgi:hypothetical protein
MKNFIKIVIAYSLFVMTSCNVQDDLSEEPKLIDTKSYEEKVDYVKSNLKNIGTKLALLVNDESIKEFVYEQVERRFDGDYNVLIEHLIDSIGQSYSAGRISSISAKSIQEIDLSLEQFKGIGQNNYYPQIYIPFFESLQIRRIGQSNAKLAMEKPPLFVLYAGNESQEIYEGYQLNDDGELAEIGILIDEAYAQNNEVWVISLNERVNNEGVIDNAWQYSESSNSRVSAYGDGVIPTIKIKSHKESWTMGASEVHVLRYVDNSTFTDRNGTQIATQGRGENEGDQIVKASRNDVKKKNTLAVDFNLVPGWNNRTTDQVYYVIFEYDTWPTGLRDARWDKSNGTLILQYRSADGWYDKRQIGRFDTPFPINNSEIEFVLQYP